MSQSEEKKIIVKELENIFTIDGKGLPAKAQKFLDLVYNYGQVLVLSVIKEISERKSL